ncbi:hypothetical protein [Nocardia wallacei]|uniref:hypothetical protein n=1 Tax=Nocardia wallacei TaxID=480035 RepID=UPI002458D8F8|nr:hypothetical protein [Nocardia wallacei]
MRIAFLGYGEIGATILGPLAARGDAAAVVTHRPEFGGLGEGHVATLAPPAPSARPVRRRPGNRTRGGPSARRGRALGALGQLAYPRTEDVLALSPLCPQNIHDALLPDYAGFGSVN